MRKENVLEEERYLENKFGDFRGWFGFVFCFKVLECFEFLGYLGVDECGC